MVKVERSKRFSYRKLFRTIKWNEHTELRWLDKTMACRSSIFVGMARMGPISCKTMSKGIVAIIIQIRIRRPIKKFHITCGKLICFIHWTVEPERGIHQETRIGANSLYQFLPQDFFSIQICLRGNIFYSEGFTFQQRCKNT